MMIQAIRANAPSSAYIQAPTAAGPSSKTPDAVANFSDRVTLSPAALDLARRDGGYDFTHMTPNRMRGLAREWHSEGKIDPVQLFELENAGVPLGRMGAHGEFIPLSETEKRRYADTPVDYMRLAGNAVRFLEDTGNAADPRSTINEWRGILAMLQGMQGQG